MAWGFGRRGTSRGVGATWWCPACRAPSADAACRTCGLLPELAPRDPGLRRLDPVIEEVELRGRILRELRGPELSAVLEADATLPEAPGDGAPPDGDGPSQQSRGLLGRLGRAVFGIGQPPARNLDPQTGRLPGVRWPWLTYAAVMACLLGLSASGLAGKLTSEVVLSLLLGGLVAAILAMRANGWGLRDLVRRLAGPLVPTPRLRRVLRVEPASGANAVLVRIDDPWPWPPLGDRLGEQDAEIVFFGGWLDEERFVADRIVPPPELGRPMVHASGTGQPIVWIAAGAAVLMIVAALRS
jgi:hypothetical protein